MFSRSTMAIYIVLKILSVICICNSINGQLLQDAKNLHTDLLNGYNKDVLPNADESTPLDISVSFLLFAINSFKEVEERISVSAGVGLTWNDPSLTWDPLLYGGKETIFFTPDHIWTPLIHLLNTPNDIKSVGEDSKYVATVSYNGSVDFVPGDVMEATCPTDVSKFPLDVQTCTLEFVPWGFLANSIKLTPAVNEIYLPYFTANSDWTMTKNSVSTEVVGVGIYSFKVSITIKREPAYYIVTVLLPTVLFCLLNPLVFILPENSGGRLSLSMTILLSYAIFLSIVSRSVPATSNPMCLLLIALIAIMIVSGFIVIFVMMSLKYYLKEEIKIGKCSGCLLTLLCLRQEVDDGKDRSVSGPEFAACLDRLFIIVSYALLLIFLVSYIIYISI